MTRATTISWLPSRTASVIVESAKAEIWNFDKTIFLNIVNNRLIQEHLMNRMHLQDQKVKFEDLRVMKVIGKGGEGVYIEIWEFSGLQIFCLLSRFVPRN